jgi:hypothetical protein
VNMVEVFLFMYEYGTLKPVKVILRRGMGGEGENNGGNKPNGVQYMCLWKCQNNCTTIIC